jgi:hypothetical protein
MSSSIGREPKFNSLVEFLWRGKILAELLSSFGVLVIGGSWIERPADRVYARSYSEGCRA